MARQLTGHGHLLFVVVAFAHSRVLLKIGGTTLRWLIGSCMKYSLLEKSTDLQLE